MSKKSKCNGHCKSCRLLGVCPEDTVYCFDCGKEIEAGEEIEIETEIIEHGRHYEKTVTVCRDCYNTLYKTDYLEDFNLL